ncbi:MAG: TolC family protein [Desulfobacteraceae bacterium]|nr:TolC family protein [Desulfobacteraceae bacterium]MDH3874308.1 TolC family protein [Desulfobacteraceae bacterium]
MTFKIKWTGLFLCFIFIQPILFPVFSKAQEPVENFTLKQTIESAVKANLGLKSSKEETAAAMAVKKAKRTQFFPTFSASYGYNRFDASTATSGITAVPKEEYSFVTSFSQPIFAGFSLLRQYDIAKLGLDRAQVREQLKRQDIILDAKNAYFQLLQKQKLHDIAQKTVVQIMAQKEVADNFYQVGMTPLNDLLQAQVELANAKQELIVAKNNLDNAESNFNTLLRRPINTPVVLKDILDFSPFEETLEYCLAEAEKNRFEIKITDMEVEIAQKELDLTKKDYYPSIDLKGNYFNYGTQWDVDGGEGIYDPSGWNIQAVAKWNFWEWGRTSYGVKEKNSRFNQAKLQKQEILDNIHLEVKTAYLRTQEAERAIKTVEKAIEQAKENFRINQERYKEQISTQTDVLIAQTLLSRTMTNYYNALYAFKISKATLYRSIGQEVIE